MSLLTLDAHAHLAQNHPASDLIDSGAVLAMTLSLDEASMALQRQDEMITWGVGCHPRFPKYENTFDINRFTDLAARTAIVGEVGLDASSRVPMELQLKNFRQILDVVARLPRLVSIHSYRATGLLLQELRQRPIAIPILHWWTGSADETSQAVELGCYFSIHSAVARYSMFRTRVPPERILLESDHGYNDPPAAIPCRIEWVEHLVAQQLKINVREVRQLAWHNFKRILEQTGTLHLLSAPLIKILETIPTDHPAPAQMNLSL